MPVHCRSRFLKLLGTMSGLVLAGLLSSAGAMAGGQVEVTKQNGPAIPGFARFYSNEKASAAEGGRLLLTSLNCLQCHLPKQSASASWVGTIHPAGESYKPAPILDGVGTRVKRSYLREFLSDPHKTKPGTTMPNLFAGVDEDDKKAKVEALVHLLASTGTPAQIRADRKSIAVGRDLYHKVGCVACHGTRDAKGDQDKIFATSVPLGNLKAKYALASLKSFLENPHLTRPSGRMPGLLTTKESSDVANYLMDAVQPKVVVENDPEHFALQPALIDKGKEYFVSMGCANCHQLQNEMKRMNTPGLADLKMHGGCLEAAPKKGVPWYGLSGVQRTALQSALSKPQPEKRKTQDVVVQTMVQFNCYACHERDKIGGVEEDLNKHFTSSLKEWGDEARLPPSLTGVGAKLQPAYFKKVLEQGSHDRPYMHTRMPKFGAGVSYLVDLFASLDAAAEGPRVAFDVPLTKVKSAGRHMVGRQAFGCINCHNFGGVKTEGVQGIDMAIMTERLRKDWFHNYLVNPTKYRAGTRMPTSFPDGTTPLKNVLAGKADAQIEAIWVYLADGKAASLPVGMNKQSIPLIPVTEAIIYRNFIQGAGPRAIGVGYPERAHLAFDANDIRLAMIWQGAFIDARRHWTDRGAGFEPPMGDNIMHLPAGVSFFVLGKHDEAWPTKPAKELGYRFGGYHLSDDQRPTFLYTFNEIKIEDFPNAVETKANPGIRRSFTLTTNNPIDNLYYRAAVADKIEAEPSGGWYRVNEWRMRIESAGSPVIRRSGKRMELLVPIRFKGNSAKIVQEYVW
jgi:mono/diheme cytochrome c family protein